MRTDSGIPESSVAATKSKVAKARDYFVFWFQKDRVHDGGMNCRGISFVF